MRATKRTVKRPVNSKATIAAERIAQSIMWLRGQKVLLDADLAVLYGVQTRVLVQAVKRNRDRFPEDFMFQLTWEEAQNSRSQNVTLKRGANTKYRPYVFTEQGVAMLSGVLNSPRAISVNIEIMRAFVKLREILSSNKKLARKLDQLERKLGAHDHAIAEILQVIRELMAPSAAPRKRSIGFAPWKDDE